jgi:hypothetical protein
MTKRDPHVNDGWLDDDEFTTTFGSMKQAMQESHDLERAYIVNHLEKFFGISCFPEGGEGSENSADWEAGFLAAISLIKGLPE